MTERRYCNGLQVATSLYDLIIDDIIPGTGIVANDFWQALAHIVEDLTPKNRELLVTRDQFQNHIDTWHNTVNEQPAHTRGIEAYQDFLEDIGYLLPEGDDFQITTKNVDPEISLLAGPQLVVPLINARYAINATNARWGSLYDALYGTDVIDGNAKQDTYDPERGTKVIAFGRNFLDQAAPLEHGSHGDARRYCVHNQQLCVELLDGNKTKLQQTGKFVGYQGPTEKPESILICNNQLHLDIRFNSDHPIGKSDKAGISDIILESALTTIQDCEDSVAAVDAEDKVQVYRNWLGLMKGDIADTFIKNNRRHTRHLNPDRHYTSANGQAITLPGRSLLFIRNVGHLMTNDAVLDKDGNEVPEGILDGMVTSLAAIHDLNKNGTSSNSRSGSVYIVKPKMHGTEEVAFTCELFSRIEHALGLPHNTLKLGLMDEERRTSLNLKACISAARERIVFINTGFMDRTGDEIHTCMEAGPVVRKDAMKQEQWIDAYERRNVAIGLACGFKGRAQIGKGMWATPDAMASMLDTKISQPKAGANCAWVPSPTAATLHALHYHQVDVRACQNTLSQQPYPQRSMMLHLPLQDNASPLSSSEIQEELDNNVQGILGYVVRWIDQGIGCSKVPDIHNVGLMEDRATLRISSQHIANWIRHSICTHAQVLDTLKRMAAVVDQQNSGDPAYRSITDDKDNSLVFDVACDLIFKGTKQANGYTEPLLNSYRLRKKQAGRDTGV